MGKGRAVRSRAGRAGRGRHECNVSFISGGQSGWLLFPSAISFAYPHHFLYLAANGGKATGEPY